jgi:hypothetical protein
MTRGQASAHGKGQAPVVIARGGSAEAIPTKPPPANGLLRYARNDELPSGIGLCSHCEAWNADAIPTKPPPPMDCFATLAMTGDTAAQ